MDTYHDVPFFLFSPLHRYRGSLIGKHFKSLAQIMPFLIHDLVPRSVLDGWCTIGSLVVLLWHTEIDDKEKYLVSLFIDIFFTIANFSVIG